MATDGDTAGLRGIRVMIAEDEAVVAFDLEFTLGDFGCTVLPPVASVADALALMARDRPDVALLDVSLSDGPSTPVARELLAAGVPYAVTSGYDTEQIAEPLLRDVPQLGKPYQATELRDTLLRLVGRA